MGSCGSSAADRAIGLDGHEALKEYVIQKNKQEFSENYIKEIYKSTSANVKRIKIKKLREIEEHEYDAKRHVEDVKLEHEKRNPGSVAKAESMHKKPAEELLGLDETLHKLEQQKAVVNDRFEQEEKEVLREIREDFEKMYDHINPTTKHLTHINTLKEADRKKAIRWGEKYAEKDIKIHNNELKDQMDKKFDFSHYEHRFENIVPSKALDRIVDDGKDRANKSAMSGSKCNTC